MPDGILREYKLKNMNSTLEFFWELHGIFLRIPKRTILYIGHNVSNAMQICDYYHYYYVFH